MRKANRYPGPCRTCGETVAAGAGYIRRVGGRWIVEHGGECQPARAGRDPMTGEDYAERQARRRDDAEYHRGRADAERWQFNRRMFGDDYAAAEELAWELKDPDPYY